METSKIFIVNTFVGATSFLCMFKAFICANVIFQSYKILWYLHCQYIRDNTMFHEHRFDIRISSTEQGSLLLTWLSLFFVSLIYFSLKIRSKNTKFGANRNGTSLMTILSRDHSIMCCSSTEESSGAHQSMRGVLVKIMGGFFCLFVCLFFFCCFFFFWGGG